MPSIPVDQLYSFHWGIYQWSDHGCSHCLQTAVLYTNCEGEHHICVITLALPTMSNLSELYASADPIALTTFLSSKAIEHSMMHWQTGSCQISWTVISLQWQLQGVQLAIVDNLKMLPVLCLGLTKHASDEGSTGPTYCWYASPQSFRWAYGKAPKSLWISEHMPKPCSPLYQVSSSSLTQTSTLFTPLKWQSEAHLTNLTRSVHSFIHVCALQLIHGQMIKMHSRFVQDVRYTPLGDLFASAGTDSKVFLDDSRTGDTMAELKDAHKGSIVSSLV